MINHSTWLEMAEVVSKDSKCVSLKVGCILVRDDHVISTGVNGTPKNFTNCCDKFTCRGPAHSKWSAKHEIHSELNSIIHSPTTIKGSVAYVSSSPCFNCSKHLIAGGVTAVYFSKRYYNLAEGEFEEIVDFYKFMKIDFIEAGDVWINHTKKEVV